MFNLFLVVFSKSPNPKKVEIPKMKFKINPKENKNSKIFNQILNELKGNRLIELNLENKNISNKDFKQFISSLSKASNIKIINLKGNQINDKIIDSLFSNIKYLKIETLNLSSNKLSPIFFSHLRKFKKTNIYLKNVHIADNDISVNIMSKKFLEFKKMGLNLIIK